MKWLTGLVFLIRVTIPFGMAKTFEVVRYEPYSSGYYELFLTSGKVVCVPIMWTIIEEK